MSGIDELISKSLTQVIKSNLESSLEKKVKVKLFSKYGSSIQQTISDFSKLEKVLREYLKYETLKFEKKCINEILSLKKQKTSYLVSIKDQNLVNDILKYFGNDEYRSIIEATFIQPLLTSEILEKTKLPKTSCYRIINNLIRNGILIEEQVEFTKKRRSISRLKPIFTKINLEINKNQKTVKLSIPKKIIQQSSTISTIFKEI